MRKAIASSVPLASSVPCSSSRSVVGELVDLIERVRHIEHRDVEFAPDPAQERQDLEPPGCVQRRQRLVHQQQKRARQQRPAERDALPLPAREHAGPTQEQPFDAQQADDGIEGRPLPGRCAACAVAQVGRHREMGEQPGILKHHAAAPPLRRHEDALAGIEQHTAVDHDPPRQRPHKPGNAGQQRRFPAAGRTENRRHALAGAAVLQVEAEGVEPVV